MSQAEAALPPPALRVADLTVSRGERLLFEGLSFAVAAGQALLVRGPNGAGKSSLLLALAGILRADRGSIGFGSDEPQQLIHFLGHQSAVKPRLTLSENLGFWAVLYGAAGVKPGAALETVGLGGLGGIEAGHLSAGQTRRLALARLLVSRRPVWLLDEPLAALDASGEALVAGLIDAHCSQGGIAVAATHQDIGLAGPSETLLLGGAA